MPAPTSLAKLDSKDLLYAVQQLIAERKVTPDRVRALALQRSQRIVEIQRELQALRTGNPAGAPRTAGRQSGRAKVSKPKRKFTMTPKARAARKIQGQYLGLLRKLQGAARAKVKALAKKGSVAAAVKAAKKLAK